MACRGSRQEDRVLPQDQPAWLGFALRVFLKLWKIMLGTAARQPASLMAG